MGYMTRRKTRAEQMLEPRVLRNYYEPLGIVSIPDDLRNDYKIGDGLRLDFYIYQARVQLYELAKVLLRLGVYLQEEIKHMIYDLLVAERRQGALDYITPRMQGAVMRRQFNAMIFHLFSQGQLGSRDDYSHPSWGERWEGMTRLLPGWHARIRADTTRATGMGALPGAWKVRRLFRRFQHYGYYMQNYRTWRQSWWVNEPGDALTQTFTDTDSD